MIVFSKCLKIQRSDMRLATSSYGGIGKSDYLVGDWSSETDVLAVRYFPSTLHQKDHHRRIVHSQRLGSAVNVRKWHWLLPKPTAQSWALVVSPAESILHPERFIYHFSVLALLFQMDIPQFYIWWPVCNTRNLLFQARYSTLLHFTCS